MSDPTDATGSSGAQMQRIWIPSNRLMRLDPVKFNPPKKYLLSKAVKDLYEALPETYKKIFDSFGTGKTTPPPLKSDPSQLAALGSESLDAIAKQKGSGTTSYLEAVTRLKASFQNLKLADANIAPLANKTASVSQAAQQAINDMIDAIHESAKQLPTTTTDDWVQTYLADAADRATATLNRAKAQYELLGKGVDDATGKLPPDVEARLKALEGKSGAGDPPPVDSSQRRLGGLDNGSGYQPSNRRLGSWNPELIPGGSGQPRGSTAPDPTLPSKTEGTTPPDTSKDDLIRNIRNIGQQPDATPQQPQYPNMATPSTMGGMSGGMDPMSMMLPSLLSAMQPNMNDRLQADPNRYDRYGQDPYDQYPQNAVPVQASPAAVTPQAPTTTPPAATTTAPAPTDKPAPAQPAAPATLTPDADGGVDYPFPDGKTQRVSVIVAKALDKAFGNKKGTDAQAAYADTTAKWSDSKQIGDRVDPSQLMTGDVGIWESPDLVAIVRAMGSEAEATLDLIVNGELRRYPDQISETTGDLGKFVGWAHPRGIEITGTSAKHTDGAAPGTVDPAASLPVVAAPAS
ncbi:hypothetical protein [Nocardia acidivorans]|uniref:hypothetical protein n=1 Tax=Nocardia acidivorans TaxID=404580 RepID=UPI00082E8FE0|nr:hypothetical protein [Nocardia acidivorans]